MLVAHVLALSILLLPLAATHLTSLAPSPPAPAARHWEYEAARQHRRNYLLRQALHSWRAAAEVTAGRLAGFWAVWQVEAPLRRALVGWRRAAAAARAERMLEGMADVHHERRLQGVGLTALGAHAAAARSAGSPGETVQWRQPWTQQQHSMQPVQQQYATQPPPPQQQQLSQQQPLVRTTIVISRNRQNGPVVQQEQRAPVPAASGGSCAAAQGMLDAVTDWRAAADFWRQRHAAFASGLGQQLGQEAAAGPDAAAVRPQTVATLAKLRAQWQQG